MRSTEFVRVRDCACPDSPHAEEGDGVLISATLPAEGGIEAEQQMTEAQEQLRRGLLSPDAFGDHLTRKWLITFVRYGAQGWNLVDEEGSPVPFDIDDLLADWAFARPVALRAGELYQASVAAPFQTAPAKPSRNGRTRATTSRRRSPTPVPSE